MSCVSSPADHFKEICPAGHGYTYSLSDVQFSVRHLGEDDLQSTGLSWEEQPPSSHPSLLLPIGPQHPSYPQTPQIPQYPVYPETPHVPQHPEYPETPAPGHPLTPQQPHHPSQPDRETPKQPEGENKVFGTFRHCQVDFNVVNVYSEW